MTEAEFTFIEAPFYQGQSHFGTCLGPAFLRQCLIDQNFNFDILSVRAEQNKSIVLDGYEELSYLVEREARRNKMFFVAGGDHSLALGSVQGLLRTEPDLKVIWVDAHGDINTRKSSLTGAFHGMPLSFLTGADDLRRPEWFTQYLKPENLIYFGVRDLDRAEKIFLEDNKIPYYTADRIQADGTSSVINEVLKQTAGSKVYLSVDSDAFDPSVAPSTGVRVGHGLNFECVRLLVQQVADACDVAGFEFVELNPQIFQSPQDVFQTAQIGIDLFKIVLEQFNKKQNKGELHGFNDRQCYSAESDLLHSSF